MILTPSDGIFPGSAGSDIDCPTRATPDERAPEGGVGSHVLGGAIGGDDRGGHGVIVEEPRCKAIV